jgi:FAD/FMN-containing dehydrogenase
LRFRTERPLFAPASNTNSDLFWAARGAGPGFFAVVTRFDLTLHELPPTIRMFAARFAMDSMPATARWLDDLHPRPRSPVLLGGSLEPAGRTQATLRSR